MRRSELKEHFSSFLFLCGGTAQNLIYFFLRAARMANGELFSYPPSFAARRAASRLRKRSASLACLAEVKSASIFSSAALARRTDSAHSLSRTSFEVRTGNATFTPSAPHVGRRMCEGSGLTPSLHSWWSERVWPS